MARNFGSTGASSLLRSATAALNKTNTYNDAMASYQFDLSAKTADDFKTYNDYLTKRIGDTQNTDPSKALTLQRTATTANRSFNSAEIGRASTNVEFGNMSNRDKYQQIVGLYQAAQNNGDSNLAQSLFSRLGSLSVTIQNEDAANANAATAAGNKASAATNKGYTDAVSAREDGLKQLNAAKLAGQITPAEYNTRVSQLYLGNAATGEPGLIALAKQAVQATGDPNGTWQSKIDGYAASPDVQKFANGNNVAKNGVDNSQVIVKNADGTYAFHDRPASEITGTQVMKDQNGNPAMDANGHVITSNSYAQPQAFTDSKGNVNGFQYVTNIDKNGKFAPGTGPGALRQIDKRDIVSPGQAGYNDPSGVPYFINEAGQKKYIGKDSKNGNAVMSNDPKVISGKYDLGDGGTNALGLKGGQPKRSDSQILGGGISSIFKGGPSQILSNLFNRNNNAQAQQRVQDMENAKAANAAAVAQAQRQAQLLPVFRAPAYQTPAPAPKPIAPNIPAYNPSPLPGQPGYVNAVAKTQATIANPKSTAADALKSIIGF